MDQQRCQNIKVEPQKWSSDTRFCGRMTSGAFLETTVSLKPCHLSGLRPDVFGGFDEAVASSSSALEASRLSGAAAASAAAPELEGSRPRGGEDETKTGCSKNQNQSVKERRRLKTNFYGRG